jgi:hypothetical protein
VTAIPIGREDAQARNPPRLRAIVTSCATPRVEAADYRAAAAAGDPTAEVTAREITRSLIVRTIRSASRATPWIMVEDSEYRKWRPTK